MEDKTRDVTGDFAECCASPAIERAAGEATAGDGTHGGSPPQPGAPDEAPGGEPEGDGTGGVGTPRAVETEPLRR
jgi:hypothetical protein